MRDLLNLFHNFELIMIYFQRLIVVRGLLLYLIFFFPFREQMLLALTEISQETVQMTSQVVKSYSEVLR